MKYLIKFTILLSTIISSLILTRILIDKCEPYFFSFLGGNILCIFSLTIFMGSVIGTAGGYVFRKYSDWLE